MDELRLVIPDASLAEEIGEYRRVMMEAGSSMDGTGGLHRHGTVEWLANCMAQASCPCACGSA